MFDIIVDWWRYCAINLKFVGFLRVFGHFIYILRGRKKELLGCSLKISDEVSTFVRLLQASKDHLGSWDVLLWVLEVLEESVFVPGDSLLDVGVGV